MKEKRAALADRIRSEIAARTEALAARLKKATTQDLLVVAEEIANLKVLLSHLDRPQIELRRKALFVAAVAATCGLASWLLFSRVEDITIRAELEVSEASFRLAERRVILDVTPLAALDISGLDSQPSSVAFDTRSGAFQALEALSIGPVSLEEGSLVALTTTASAPTARLAIRGPATGLSATIRGHAPKTGSDLLPGVPSRREFETVSTREFVLDLTPPSGGALVLSPQIAVSELSFDRVREEGRRGDHPIVVSTILAGTLWLEEVEVEKSLRTGDVLTFETDKASLVLRSISFVDGRWRVVFDGRVGKLQTGFLNSRRNLLPTRGQWLQAQRTVWLFWGAAIYGVGLIYGVLRWFGINL